MEEKVQKETTEHAGSFEFKLEGLEDGYRVTVKQDPEVLKQQRRVGGAFINLLKQSEKAGYKLPLTFKWILNFWDRYSKNTK